MSILDRRAFLASLIAIVAYQPVKEALPKRIFGGKNYIGIPHHHIYACKISTDLGREKIYELGRKGPYFRYVEFPPEVIREFEDKNNVSNS